MIPTFDDWRATPAPWKGGAVALGNFDGVHRGHQALLAHTGDRAKALGAPLVALTFEPHPRRFFVPDTGPFRLTLPPAKERLLAQYGVQAVLAQHFDAAFAALSPDAFIDDVLLKGLGARHVVCGYDFTFGARRGGNVEMLREKGGERRIEALRQHRLHAVLRQQANLGSQQGEAERTGVGHEEAARMGLEGEHDQRRAERGGVFGGLPEQRLVAAMHAVEIAERHGGALPPVGRGLPIVEDGRRHAESRRGTSTVASPSITTLAPFRHWVLSVTRRRLSSMAVMVQTAVMVSPISTGARKLSDWEM